MLLRRLVKMYVFLSPQVIRQRSKYQRVQTPTTATLHSQANPLGNVLKRLVSFRPHHVNWLASSAPLKRSASEGPVRTEHARDSNKGSAAGEPKIVALVSIVQATAAALSYVSLFKNAPRATFAPTATCVIWGAAFSYSLWRLEKR